VPAPPPAGRPPADKSPIAAALITIPFPGFGHLYGGVWTRGVLVMIASYFTWFALAVTGKPWALLFYPVIVGLFAWDAYRQTVLENSAARAAFGVPPALSLLLFWAAVRSSWISMILAFGAVTLTGPVEMYRDKNSLGVILALLPPLLVFYLAWLAIRDTWRGVTRARPTTRPELRDESNATVVVGAILALMLTIVYPRFQDLIRFSAEGAMKGNLSALRQGLNEYKLAHGGAAPSSLEALGLPPTPLFASFSSMPHPKSHETLILTEAVPTDSGKWAYVVSGSSVAVFIDCTHTDSKGSAWTGY